MTAIARSPAWGSDYYRVTNELVSHVKVPKKAPVGVPASAGTHHECNVVWTVPLRSGVVSPTIAIEAESKAKDSVLEVLADPKSLEIREKTRQTAISLVESLRRNHIAPKLMEDTEGDLILIWGNPAVMLISVEEDTLHSIAHPGRTDAVYYPSEKVTASVIPESVLKRIPSIEHAAIFSL
ncbi:hypothetical protein [Rhodobacter sp. SY28-1]|uniref:hypothetical protein n=1 Tax=Rhodobacter sp. SY28-1 TaxID=2562317 RepID=UPI0010C039ED|nr:hypothetical protein [Rhodobacter sp. SY28-1]